MKKLTKKYLVLGSVLIIMTSIVIFQAITPKPISEPVNLQPRITPEYIVTPSINYTESTVEWNTQIQRDLKEYEKTDKARIDETLSVVRLNSPIRQDGFVINYSYRTATYTITLNQPETENQQRALDWLNNLGISSSDLKYLRLEWVTAP